jgi:hypothetical protein
VMVMTTVRNLVADTAIFQRYPTDYVQFLEQLHGAKDCGAANIGERVANLLGGERAGRGGHCVEDRKPGAG